MAEQIAQINIASGSTETFGSSFGKINQIISLCNSDVVTVNVGGGVTVGNGFVVGKFGANLLTTSQIVAGNTSTIASQLNVLSNTLFTNNLIVGGTVLANTTLTVAGNVLFGNSTVNVSSNSTNLSISNSIQSTTITNVKLYTGNSTANVSITPTSINLGSWVSVTNVGFLVGNSTIYQVSNTTYNAIYANSTVYSQANSTAFSVTNSTFTVNVLSNSISVSNYTSITTITPNTVNTATLQGNLNTSYLQGIIAPVNINGAYPLITSVGNLVSLNVTSNALFNNNIIVAANATVTKFLNVNAGIYATGNATTNAISTTGDIYVNGSVDISNNLIVGGDFVVTGTFVSAGPGSGYSNVIPVAAGYYCGNSSIPFAAGYFGNVNISGSLVVNSVTGNLSSNIVSISSTLEPTTT